MALSWRLLWRDFRSGELRLLLLALVISTSAVSAVGFFSQRIHSTLGYQAHQLLGADLVLSADHPWPEKIAQLAGGLQFQLEAAKTLVFPSMVRVFSQEKSQPQLVSVKAVSSGYPLRGSLYIGTKDKKTAQLIDIPTAGIPKSGEVWPEHRLALQLNLQIGDSVQLGNRTFLVGQILTLEPDRGTGFLNVAPRLMMNLQDVDSTGLLGIGARAKYRLLLRGERKALADFKSHMQTLLKRGERIEDIHNVRSEVRDLLKRSEHFLKLTSMLSVILASIVVALASQRHMARHIDSCAIMRAMGATQQYLLRLYSGQIFWLWLIAGSIGVLIGYLAHHVLLLVLSSGLQEISISATNLSFSTETMLLTAAQGVMVTGALLFGFALPPLLQLSKIPALSILRRELGELKISVVSTYFFGALLLVGLVLWMVQDLRLGFYVSIGFVLCFLSFIGLSRAVLWLAKFILQSKIEANNGFGWQRGLKLLLATPWASALQIAILSLSLLCLLLLAFLQHELLGSWQKSLPENTPNHFVIGIQPEQKEAVLEFFNAHNIQAELAPMVRGRLMQIDDHRVSAADYVGNRRAQRLVEREFNLSWRAELPIDNSVSSGRWIEPGESGAASIEEGLAQALGIKTGQKLKFNIAGENLEVKIVGLRKLRWDTLRANFFVLLAQKDLQDAPASYMTSVYLPTQKQGIINDLIHRFSNQSVIDVGLILRQMQRIISQVILAIQFVFVFSTLSGLLALYTVLYVSIDKRCERIVLHRVLGAQQKQIIQPLLGELILVGLFSGLIAGVFAVGCSAILSVSLLKIEVGSNLGTQVFQVVLAMGIGVLIYLLTGMQIARRLLRTAPSQMLRQHAN